MGNSHTHLTHVGDTLALFLERLGGTRNQTEHALPRATQACRRTRWQPPIHLPHGPCPGESGSAGASRGPETGAAPVAAASGSLAQPCVHVEQLAAMALEPIVVERQDSRNTALGERPRDCRRQARQMMD